ncbi:hypothetical protein ACI1UN_03855 [Lactococcus petauri]
MGQAINEILDDSNSFLQQLTDNINSVLTDGLTDKLDKVDCQLKDLETEIITTAIGGKGYEKLSSQVLSLREERCAFAKKILEEVATQRLVTEMDEFMKTHDHITEYSDIMVRRLNEKITIFSKNIVVDFKSGLSVRVDI